MSKEKTLSPAEIIAALESAGLPVSEELRVAANEKQENVKRDEAYVLVESKAVEIEKESPEERVTRIEGIVTALFGLSTSFSSNLTGETRNKPGQGIGTHVLRTVSVETPEGTLTVKLSTEN